MDNKVTSSKHIKINKSYRNFSKPILKESYVTPVD